MPEPRARYWVRRRRPRARRSSPDVRHCRGGPGAVAAARRRWHIRSRPAAAGVRARRHPIERCRIRRTAHAAAPIRPSTIRNARKNRTASGISAPNKIKHPPNSPLSSPRQLRTQRLTAPVTFAAANTNKELKSTGNFQPNPEAEAFYGKRRINGKTGENPGFNRSLTILPAKSARVMRRGVAHADYRYSDSLDAAHPHAVASGAPARARRERRQCRYAQLPARAIWRRPISTARCKRLRSRWRAPIPAYRRRSAAAREFAEDRNRHYEIRPRGNAVSHEEEMIKLAGNQMDYDAVTSLYTHSLRSDQNGDRQKRSCGLARSRLAETTCHDGLHQIARNRRLRNARAGRPHAHHLGEHRQLRFDGDRRPAAILTGAAS